MASSDQSDWSSSEEIDNETGFSGGNDNFSRTKLNKHWTYTQ